MDRYFPVINDKTHSVEFEESSLGEWVKYEDVIRERCLTKTCDNLARVGGYCQNCGHNNPPSGI